MKEWLIGHGTENPKEGFLWNAIGGAACAGQCAVILVFVAHEIGMETAGAVTIAYADANLFASIAKYGMRNYQATDRNGYFSFGDYFYSRLCSVLLTIFLYAVYFVYCYASGGWNPVKMAILGEVGILKLMDAAEDVYLGRCQQVGRFSMGAKIMALRLIISTVFICGFIYAGAGIHFSVLAGIVVSLLLDLYFIRQTACAADCAVGRLNWQKVQELMKKCLPLCAGVTLSVYVGNAPKYMIDSYMDERTQAVFGYLMLPIFVIVLLNNFIYQPVVKSLGDMWGMKRREEFWCKVRRQCRIVIALTVAAMGIGAAVALPALSVLYHAELGSYRAQFMVLVCGGGLYALAVYLSVVLTVMRRQKYIAAGYAVVSCFSLLFGKYFVVYAGMSGAAVIYLLINLMLAVGYMGILFILRYIRMKGKS